MVLNQSYTGCFLKNIFHLTTWLSRTRPTRGRPVTGQVPRVLAVLGMGLEASPLQVLGWVAELGMKIEGPTRCQCDGRAGCDECELAVGGVVVYKHVI